MLVFTFALFIEISSPITLPSRKIPFCRVQSTQQFFIALGPGIMFVGKARTRIKAPAGYITSLSHKD
jgi:hypothetical protein